MIITMEISPGETFQRLLVNGLPVAQVWGKAFSLNELSRLTHHYQLVVGKFCDAFLYADNIEFKVNALTLPIAENGNPLIVAERITATVESHA